MKKVLITGATGFVGRNLIAALAERGVEITAVLRKEGIRPLWMPDDVKCVFCALDDRDGLVQALNGCTADVLYHLAWDGVDTTVKNDYARQKHNLDYAACLMETAHQLGVAKVIVPGSVSEYAYAGEPVNGTQAPSPSSCYAAMKTAAHLLCELYARQHGMRFIYLLVPSLYGPGRSDSNILTYTIESLLRGERPSYTRLEQKWEYVYISDLVDALIGLGEQADGVATYAIGGSEQQPLAQFIRTIRDMIAPGQELGIGEKPYLTDRVDDSLVDDSALRCAIGYCPKVSFAAGIRRMIEERRRA